MSYSKTSSYRHSASDHFEPQDVSDPATQRKLRGQLEQIDYTAFASNREVIAHILGHADAAKFQRLGVAAAHARAIWVKEALAMTETPHALTAEQVSRLHMLRSSFEELTEVYEAMRRMVERNYISYRAAPPT